MHKQLVVIIVISVDHTLAPEWLILMAERMAEVSLGEVVLMKLSMRMALPVGTGQKARVTN